MRNARNVDVHLVYPPAYRTQLGTFEGRWHKLKQITSLIDNLDREMAAGRTTSAASDTSCTEVDGLTTGEVARGPVDVSVDAAAAPGRIVRFEPAIPQCCMVHCYIRGPQVRRSLSAELCFSIAAREIASLFSIVIFSPNVHVAIFLYYWMIGA